MVPKKPIRVSVRMTDEERGMLEAVAAEQHLTLTDTIVWLIAREYRNLCKAEHKE